MIKCINKKPAFKNLTVNKDYEGVPDGETYVVVNDAGLRSRYSKIYFREVPVVPPPPAIRNILDALTIEVDVNSNPDDVEIVITLNRTERHVNLRLEQSMISCGIWELDGISDLKATVNEMYANKVATIVGTKTEMFNAIMTLLIAELRENISAMCFLFSDAIRERDSELDSVITSLSRNNLTDLNPNSSNTITLWVI